MSDEIEKKLARVRGRGEVNELVEEEAMALAKQEGSQAFNRYLLDDPERQPDRDEFRRRVREGLGL